MSNPPHKPSPVFPDWSPRPSLYAGPSSVVFDDGRGWCPWKTLGTRTILINSHGLGTI